MRPSLPRTVLRPLGSNHWTGKSTLATTLALAYELASSLPFLKTSSKLNRALSSTTVRQCTEAGPAGGNGPAGNLLSRTGYALLAS